MKAFSTQGGPVILCGVDSHIGTCVAVFQGRFSSMLQRAAQSEHAFDLNVPASQETLLGDGNLAAGSDIEAYDDGFIPLGDVEEDDNGKFMTAIELFGSEQH